VARIAILPEARAAGKKKYVASADGNPPGGLRIM
jgi:hypothetical protein